jgi:hypothetical protein
MPQLVFQTAELQREIEAIKEFASKYLAAESFERLDRLKYQLGPLTEAGGGNWSVPIEEPIVTRPVHLHGAGRGPQVWGEVSATWDFERVGRTRSLRLAGIASTRVSIMRIVEGVPERVAMWRMEIGDEASPGCYFHTHVLGDVAHGPFPDWLIVPRLPGLVPTPASALEFLLSELLQEEWARLTSQSRGPLELWSAVQMRRLSGLVEWHRRVLEGRPGSVVPWTALKLAKPDAELVQSLGG